MPRERTYQFCAGDLSAEHGIVGHLDLGTIAFGGVLDITEKEIRTTLTGTVSRLLRFTFISRYVIVITLYEILL